MYMLDVRNQSILISNALNRLGLRLLSKWAKYETDERMLKAYLKVAELKGKEFPQALEELYYHDLLPSTKEGALPCRLPF